MGGCGVQKRRIGKDRTELIEASAKAIRDSGDGFSDSLAERADDLWD